MRPCPRCDGPVGDAFRFCPWCAAPQRRKLVEFFRADPEVEAGRSRALRVSRYLGEQRHVRFSIWDDGVASAAVSIPEEEADRLGRFVLDTAPRVRPRRRLSLRR
jgi:hypothetical protein